MKQGLIGVAIGAALVLGGLAAWTAWQQAAPAPGEVFCARSVELCELEASAGETCETWVSELEPTASATDLERLFACGARAESCAAITGCVAGAGLKQSFGETLEFFKGMGDALGVGKRR